MSVMLSLSKHLCRSLAVAIAACVFAVPPAFAHAKHKLRLDISLVPLDTSTRTTCDSETLDR